MSAGLLTSCLVVSALHSAASCRFWRCPGAFERAVSYVCYVEPLKSGFGHTSFLKDPHSSLVPRKDPICRKR